MPINDIDATEQTLVKQGPAVAAPVTPIAHFVSFVQDGRLHRVRVPPEGVSVGRGAGCDIVFAVPEVSRLHCRFHLDADGVVATDPGSTNGTFVAGRRITEPVRLGNGSHITVGQFHLRYEQRDERELESEARLTAELRQAVEYVRAILPEPLTEGPVRAEWWYVPSSELGGDAFGYDFIDPTTLAGFLIDVSGHGIGAGMHAVNVASTIRRRALPGVDFRDPGQVAAGLNAMFPMEQHGGLIFTLWYFSYDTETGLLRYCAAGHHAAYLTERAKLGAEPVWLRSPSIGMLPPRAWPTGEVAVAPGSRLYIFSDGAFEVMLPDGSQWQIDDLRRIIAGRRAPGLGESQRIYQAVRSAARPGPLDDDFSVLVLHF